MATETDAESEFRTMVAIGTLVCVNSQQSTMVGVFDLLHVIPQIYKNEDTKEAAKLMDVATLIRSARRTTGESEVKLKQVENELMTLLR